MMKFLRYTLAIIFAIVANLSLNAAEVLKELSFPDGNKANNKVSNYTSTWSAKMANDVWQLKGFNNNKWNDDWNYVKCQVSANSTASIVTPTIGAQVGFVVFTVDNVSEAEKAQFSVSATFTDGTAMSQSTNIYIHEGKVSVPISRTKAVSTFEISVISSASQKIEVQISKIQIFSKGDAADEAYDHVDGLKGLFEKYHRKTYNVEVNFNNAKVLCVSGKNNDNYAYVRDGDLAIALSGIDKTKLSVNSIINGSLKFKTVSPTILFPSVDLPGNFSYANITPSDEPAEPRVATIAELKDGKFKNDLVVIKNFTLVLMGNGYGGVDENGNSMYVVDKYSVDNLRKLEKNKQYTAVGIFGTSKTSEENEATPILWITQKLQDTTTGISDITINEVTKDAPAYNLAGQKVGKDYKGVVIKAGKKMIQK